MFNKKLHLKIDQLEKSIESQERTIAAMLFKLELRITETPSQSIPAKKACVTEKEYYEEMEKNQEELAKKGQTFGVGLFTPNQFFQPRRRWDGDTGL